MDIQKALDIRYNIERRVIIQDSDQYSYVIKVWGKGDIDIDYNKLPEPENFPLAR